MSRGQGPMSAGTARLGLLARIADHVDSFEDRIVQRRRGLTGSPLAALVAGAGGGPEADARLRPSYAAPSPTARGSDPEAAQPSPHGDDGDDDGGGAGVLESSECGFADVGSHLRAFLDSGGWDTCAIEQHDQGRACASRPVRRQMVSGRRGWQRVRRACGSEGVMVRGWVSEHLRGEPPAMRVRIVAIEMPTARNLSDSDEEFADRVTAALVPPEEDREGLFGVLRAESTSAASGAPAQTLLPVGALLRASLLRGSLDRRLLRECDASCELSLVSAPSQEVGGGGGSTRPIGMLSAGGRGSEASQLEWPVCGVSSALATDLRFANRANLRVRIQLLGLRHLHSTLLLESREPAARGVCLGARLSSIQGRAWADRRVREGVSRARSGDQKGALERYDAALELCPRHKEALVARGAALANVGRHAQALQDLDLALKIDPADRNAQKYKEITRRRAMEEAGVGAADAKRIRRTTSAG
eukprot:gnl/TRDRNA2_/TRDRNA2_83734_c0_seq1.p1 gnl/TRDRNA2_/TRDRNA2_83734_c0~~gnl/TRDRNA2_/TRDRNA2_83734_c0_seq1.p1  ORF type:complete len:475 (+),score=69.99 gnl/TRDRNA2_/TRDRNA2_83734_c0_seq1:61-1485(+)